jgi:DNA-binding response OmpR family regulator
MKLLVIEDDRRVADFLTRGLKAERHAVAVACSGEEGLELGASGEFDVIILDLLLPTMHGHEVCQELRLMGVQTPILMLSALDAVENRVEGLRLGADDYLTKPFAFDELLARLDALVRRRGVLEREPRTFVVADLVFDRERLTVSRAGRALKLTAKELAILELLMSVPGKIFSRERILSNVWGVSEDPLTNVVDVYIGRLRKQLSANREPAIIETVRGMGYRLLLEQDGNPDKK